MRPNDHVETMRVEIAWPRRGSYGTSANVWLHISVVQFFKALTEARIEEIQQTLIGAGRKYFGETASDFDFAVRIDSEHGLISWDCPGDACGFHPSNKWGHMKKEDQTWIKYCSHNLDTAEQLHYLLAAACYLRSIIEGGPIE